MLRVEFGDTVSKNIFALCQVIETPPGTLSQITVRRPVPRRRPDVQGTADLTPYGPD